MDTSEGNNRKAAPETAQGIVTAQKCDCCGHHEMGVTLDSGEYLPLKPGMRIVIMSR